MLWLRTMSKAAKKQKRELRRLSLRCAIRSSIFPTRPRCATGATRLVGKSCSLCPDQEIAHHPVSMRTSSRGSQSQGRGYQTRNQQAPPLRNGSASRAAAGHEGSAPAFRERAAFLGGRALPHGFRIAPRLAAHTKIHVKTLHQMFGPAGNPTARNLFEIVAYLQHAEGVRFEVRSARSPAPKKRRQPSRRPKRLGSLTAKS